MRDKTQYLQKLQTRSESSRLNFTSAYNTMWKLDSRFEDVIDRAAKLPPADMAEICTDMLQRLVLGLTDTHHPRTILSYVGEIRRYMFFRGARIVADDIRQVTIPRITHEEKHPLTVPEIRRILAYSAPQKIPLYLLLLSSGMRIGEAIQLTPADIDMTTTRPTIHIRAETTKTRRGRITYCSSECADAIRPLLDAKGKIFGTATSPHNTVISETRTYAAAVKRAGLDSKYMTGRNQITLHVYRAFFFTRAARVHDSNYAHMMTGHSGYLMTYDRLTDAEKLEMYLKLEKELMVF